MITVKEFDRLSRRDFENGAVISGIRSQLKQDAERIRELEDAIRKHRWDVYEHFDDVTVPNGDLWKVLEE